VRSKAANNNLAGGSLGSLGWRFGHFARVFQTAKLSLSHGESWQPSIISGEGCHTAKFHMYRDIGSVGRAGMRPPASLPFVPVSCGEIPITIVDECGWSSNMKTTYRCGAPEDSSYRARRACST
jgi:hypothetical protein